MTEQTQDLFAELRSLMQRDHLDADARWRLWRLLHESHSLSPSRHAGQVLPYLEGFAHHFVHPLVTAYSCAQLELAARVAPLAVFNIGVHFDYAEVRHALTSPVAARIGGICLSAAHSDLIGELAAAQENLVSLTHLDLSLPLLEEDDASAMLSSGLLTRLSHLVLAPVDDEEEPAPSMSLLTSGQLERLVHLCLNESSLNGSSVDAIANARELSNLTHLDLNDANLQGGAAIPLAQSPYITKLEYLGLANNYLDDEDVEALATSPNYAHLDFLTLYDNDFGEDGALALARSGWLPALRRLDLGSNPIGLGGVNALGGSAMVARLEHLEIGEVTVQKNRRTKTDIARAFLEGDAPLRLTHLNLEGNGLGTDALVALAQTPNLPHLEKLDLCDNPLTTQGITALGQSTNLPTLERLILSRCEIEPDGLRAIASAPAFASLVQLDLEDNGVTAADAAALLSNPTLAHVRELDLSANPLGPGAADALRDVLPRLTHLRLFSTDLSDDDMHALTRIAAPQLEQLDISSHDLDDLFIQRLLESNGYPHLEVLVVEDVIGIDAFETQMYDGMNLPNLRRLSAELNESFEDDELGVRRHPKFAFVHID